ncbi:uncharacterized protein CPUR_05832 [Claviceps purpurea 20.1]|uniref:SAP domain-containing protein n=1 Tax=Claviceps purpurea (strain 20.1) TaxID=1111077 RepID=M1WGQ0_CLAP2|nr:hypothetical protein E4U38_007839 [Claviceps purpurea]CCE31974.1 uncharacterized protein CPUR_05832 [Claviceps purpurea 20.1]
MGASTSTTTVTGPQPDFTVAAECGRGLLLQLERCKNLPSVHDGAHWVATSEKLDRLTEKMDALITKVNTITQDVGVLKTDVAGLNVKLTTMDQNSMARSENSLAMDTTTFAPLMNITTGQEIQGPSCQSELSKMTAAEMSSCLEELGINPKPTNAEMRNQLLRAYGVKKITASY